VNLPVPFSRSDVPEHAWDGNGMGWDGAVVLDRAGPGRCKCTVREAGRPASGQWRCQEKASESRTPRPAAAFPKSRDDDWDVPLLTASLAG